MDGNDFPKLGINTLQLVADAEEAIENARQAMRTDDEDFGAVNWGDIGVSDVEYRLSMLSPGHGPLCVVTIEEASPDCRLGRWVHDHLVGKGYQNVAVECEW